MIYVLMTSNSLSCAKALKFFKKNGIEVTVINLIRSQLDEKLILDILALTYNGFEDIIAMHSDFIVNNNIKLEDYTTRQLIHLIQHEPSILRKPIIIQYNTHHSHPYRLMIGYNTQDIEIFLRDDE